VLVHILKMIGRYTSDVMCEDMKKHEWKKRHKIKNTYNSMLLAID
ncbi:unnamed protein product, partial [marine sediment metagenome]